MENIMNLIIAYSPAITAIIGIIASMVVSIKKIKGHNEKTLNEVKTTEAKIIEINTQMIEENQKLRNENAELKDALNEIIRRMNHIHKK